MLEQAALMLFQAFFLFGGIGCFIAAVDRGGEWAIAGSILIFTFVYLGVKTKNPSAKQ